MINQNIIALISQQLNLNPRTLKVSTVFGGLMHETYCLQDAEKSFALKILNPILFNEDHFLNIEIIETIAAQFYQQGIFAVNAQKIAGHYSFKYDGKLLLIYPWIRGKSIAVSKLDPKQIIIIGEQLAKIHTAKVNSDLAIDVSLFEFSSSQLEKLLCCLQTDIALDQQLKLFISQIPMLFDKQTLATANLVISHRDLTPSNVIWENETTPCIIDWEYLGWIDRGVDLLTVALNWSGLLEGKFQDDLFQTVIKGYQQQANTIPVINSSSFSAYFAYCLHWVEFNFKRMELEPDYKEIGQQQIRLSLTAICVVERLQQKLLGMIDAIDRQRK